VILFYSCHFLKKVYFSKCNQSEENLKSFPIESDKLIDLWLCLNGAPFEGLKNLFSQFFEEIKIIFKGNTIYINRPFSSAIGAGVLIFLSKSPVVHFF